MAKVKSAKKQKAKDGGSRHPAAPFKYEPQPQREGLRRRAQRKKATTACMNGDRFIDRTKAVNKLMMCNNKQTLALVPWLPHPAASLSDELQAFAAYVALHDADTAARAQVLAELRAAVRAVACGPRAARF